jgi:hypothetical protein
MRYLFAVPGATRRVMHIARHTVTGETLFEPLCSTRGPYNRTINAPWGLGRPVCKHCKRILGAASGTLASTPKDTNRPLHGGMTSEGRCE